MEVIILGLGVGIVFAVAATLIVLHREDRKKEEEHFKKRLAQRESVARVKAYYNNKSASKTITPDRVYTTPRLSEPAVKKQTSSSTIYPVIVDDTPSYTHHKSDHSDNTYSGHGGSFSGGGASSSWDSSDSSSSSSDSGSSGGGD